MNTRVIELPRRQAGKLLQSEVTYVKGLIDQTKRELAQSFLDWYAEKYRADTAQASYVSAPTALGAIDPKSGMCGRVSKVLGMSAYDYCSLF